jgi:hypothetical protein
MIFPNTKRKGHHMNKRGVVGQAVSDAVDTGIATGVQFLESLSPFNK